MEALPANVRTLIEQLGDVRQLHATEAGHSNGVHRHRHRATSDAYATILAEIERWESCHSDRGARRHSSTPLIPTAEDGYAELLERLYQIHAGNRQAVS